MNKQFATRSIRTAVATAVLAVSSIGVVAANPAVAHATTPGIRIVSETQVNTGNGNQIQVRVVGGGFAPGSRVLVGLGYERWQNGPAEVTQVTTIASQMGINFSGGTISATLTMPGSAACMERHWVQASDPYSSSNVVVRPHDWSHCIQ